MPNHPTNWDKQEESTPAVVPNSLTTVFDGDCWLEFVQFTNVTTSAATVNVADKQETPMSCLVDYEVLAKDTVLIPFNSRYMPGGVTWVSGTENALVGYMRVSRIP